MDYTLVPSIGCLECGVQPVRRGANESINSFMCCSSEARPALREFYRLFPIQLSPSLSLFVS
jgi:hypothetical protein